MQNQASWSPDSNFKFQQSLRDHLFMTSKKSGFWPPLLSVHTRPPELDPLPLVDVHTRLIWNTHRSLETAIDAHWPSGPKAEIRQHDCNLFKTVLLVIYITNLYPWKISTFYSVQRRNSGKNDANFFAWEEDRMTSVDSNFNFLCDLPPFTCVHLSLTPSPSVWTS